MRNRIIAMVMAATFVVAGAACEAQDYTNDFVANSFSSPSTGALKDDTNYPNACDNPGTPGHEDCPWPEDAVLHIYNSAQYQCVGGDNPVSGAAWDDGTANHLPTSELVNCWIDEVMDDPNDSGDPASVVCIPNRTGGPQYRQWGEADDCQTPDGDSSYENSAAHTTVYRDSFAGSYAKAERTLVLVRDWSGLTVDEGTGTPPVRAAHCITGFGTASTLPVPHWICPS